jgi:hypothetical protein
MLTNHAPVILVSLEEKKQETNKEKTNTSSLVLIYLWKLLMLGTIVT